jgi:predicted flavoprotein YhiN
MYGLNGRFLYSAFHSFFRGDLLTLLKRYGLDTVTERGGRIFPSSGNAGDVVNVLLRYATEKGVDIRRGVHVTEIHVADKSVIGIQAENTYYPARAIILATGGASYPGTGSSGDGYRMAVSLGHTLIPLRPSLVPLIVKEVERARSMQGISLRNIRMTAYKCPADEIKGIPAPAENTGRGIDNRNQRKSIIESRMGEMMITHFGIGGPITLQMSLAIVDALEDGPVSVSIDLKPALTEEQLHLRLQREFDRSPRKSYRKILGELLPRKMIGTFVDLTGISPDKPGNQINSQERTRLVYQLKSLKFNIEKPLPLAAAMVTAGGLSLKEIDPRTMASRLIRGLYFCGEVMDIDADTGGYNLQAAFSTGYVAGEHAVRYVNAVD